MSAYVSLIIQAIHPVQLILILFVFFFSSFIVSRSYPTQKSTPKMTLPYKLIIIVPLLHPIITSSLLWDKIAGLKDWGGGFYYILFLPINGLILSLCSIYITLKCIKLYNLKRVIFIVLIGIIFEFITILSDILVCAFIPVIASYAKMNLRFDLFNMIENTVDKLIDIFKNGD